MEPREYDGFEKSPEYQELVRALIAQIHEAFADTQYPGDDNIAYDNENYEGEEIRDMLKGKAWQEVSIEVLRQNTSSISFVSEEGFYYYLPAYLIVSLHPEADIIYDRTIGKLMPAPYGDKTPEEFTKNFEKITPSQKAAICAFLKFQWLKIEEWPEDMRSLSDVISANVNPADDEISAALHHWHCL